MTHRERKVRAMSQQNKKGKVKDPALAKRARAKTMARAKSYWQLYLFLIPAVLYFGIFRYIPMAGVQIAFKDYNVIGGIWGSPWAGLKHFIRFFESPSCLTVIGNTLKISILNLLFGFPLPIILALLINQTRSKRFAKIVQTTIYAPHFISAVIIVGMLNLFLAPSTGILNQILRLITGDGSISIMFMGNAAWFPAIYVISEIWQNMGYNSIVYTAALSGVSPELHESAIMDGATVIQRILYIDIPSIAPTIVILLIMNTGRVLTVGYEKIFLMQNSLNRSASEVISTYVYQQSFGSGGIPNFSYSSAIGLFESVVSLILILTVNKIAQKYADMSLV